MRIRLVFLFAALAFTPAAFAQDGSLFLSSQRPPVQLRTDVVYQEYTQDDVSVSEVSVPVSLTLPIGRSFGVSVVAHQANVSGDSLESVSGITDVQVGLSYVVRLGVGTVVLNLGANLPSGKRELTPPEFATTILLSQHYYSFQVPGFGQGFNVAPGFVWAFPLAENVTAGVGAAYQYRGPYRPLSTLDGEYDPGDEVLLTGGLDVRASATTNVSADVTYTLYASDSFGEEETFDPGDKVIVTGQVRSLLGPNDIRIVARYRSVGKSTLPAELSLPDDELRLLPAQILLQGTFHRTLSSAFTLGALARARLFDENVLFESASLIDLGLLPAVAISPQVTVQARGIYTLGDFTGFEVGGGILVEL